MLAAICSIFLVMNTNAQSIKNYDEDWKTVEDNIEKGLPASALDLVNKGFGVHNSTTTGKPGRQLYHPH